MPSVLHHKTWPPPRSNPKSGGIEDLSFTDPRPSSLPGGPRVTGTLRLRGMKRLTEIPESLFAGHSLELIGCPALRALPPIAQPLRLVVLDGVGVESLPESLRFEKGAVLKIQNCFHLKSLPASVGEGKLARILIRNCPGLTALPALSASKQITLERWKGKVLEHPIRAPFIHLLNCPQLEFMDSPPHGEEIIIQDCPKLVRMTAPAGEMALLYLKNCPALPALPDGMRFYGCPAQLILRECGALAAFPAGVSARPHPKLLKRPPLVVEADPPPRGRMPVWPFKWQVRVRQVLLEPAAVLDPEGINPLVVLTHPNAEVRRVLMENLGMGKLMEAVPHEILDQDTDPGGPRRLIEFRLSEPPHSVRLSLPGPAGTAPPDPGGVSLMERAGQTIGRLILSFYPRRKAPPPVPQSAVVVRPQPAPSHPVCCLECRCPSTGRRYLLPVPPTARTCRAAAAWMAGFDNPDDYAPLLET